MDNFMISGIQQIGVGTEDFREAADSRSGSIPSASLSPARSPYRWETYRPTR